MAGAALFALAVAVVGWRIWAGLDHQTPPRSIESALVDFRDAVYYPVVAFLDGENPYDRVRIRERYPVNGTIGLYAPLTLLLHLPLGLLPHGAAELVFVVVSFGLIVVLALVALRIHGWVAEPGAVLGFAGLLALSRPGHWNLYLGQVALEVGLATLAALWWARTRPLAAGLGVAIASYKATYGLPLLVLMAVRRDWRALALGLGTAGILTSLPLAFIVARSGLGTFVADLFANYAARSATARFDAALSTFRVDAVALVSRVLGDAPGLVGTLALTAVVLAVAAAALRRLAARRDRETRRLGLAIAALAIVLCTYHQQYDLVLLAPLLVSAWPLRPLRSAQIPAALIAVPFGNYLASGGMQRLFGASDAAVMLPSSLNIVALLAAFVLLVRRAFAAEPDA